MNIRTLIMNPMSRGFIYASMIGLFVCGSSAEPGDGRSNEIEVSRFPSLSSAVLDPATAGKKLILTTEIKVEKGLTVPDDRGIRMAVHGKLLISSGVTVTIKGAFQAEARPVFSEDGTVVFGKQSAREIYPQWWGAVGDGVTDCYRSLQALTRSVNASGGGHVVFPSGTYVINRYKITDGPRKNAVSDIVFENCSGLHITGYKAALSVAGDFTRSADVRTGKYLRSYSNSVIPLRIRNCRDVVVEGLELNGNVDKMLRDKGVVESFAHGIVIQGGDGFLLKDLYVHHFQTDGVNLNGNRVDTTIYPCRNGRLVNVNSAHNARQGMSVIQARNILCEDCIFRDTGRTGGGYGWHAPAAGVDIEPNFTTATTGIRAYENTGQVVFLRCRFENNERSQFQAVYPQATDTVLLRDCVVDAKKSDYLYAFVLAVNDGVIEHSLINAGNGSVYAGYGKKFMNLQKTVVRDCDIWSTMHGIVAANESEVLIESNRIINDYAFPDARRHAAFLKNGKCIFRNNYLFLGKNVYAGGGKSQTGSYVHVRESSRNTFDTDLVPREGGHFATDYAETAVVREDRYQPAMEAAYRPYADAVGIGANSYSRK